MERERASTFSEKVPVISSYNRFARNIRYEILHMRENEIEVLSIRFPHVFFLDTAMIKVSPDFPWCSVVWLVGVGILSVSKIDNRFYDSDCALPSICLAKSISSSSIPRAYNSTA